jgi:hypothetical protein
MTRILDGEEIAQSAEVREDVVVGLVQPQNASA